MSQKLDNAFALLIGVGGADIPETVKDATDIRDVLIDEKFAGYNPDNVILLTNKDASRDGIIDGVKQLADKCDKNSSCLIFYSGHGGYYEAEDQYYFQPSDFDVDKYEETWIKAEKMKKEIGKIPAKNLVFFLDCCHAAGVSKKSKKIGQTKEIDVPKKADKLASKVDRGDGGMSVISSSSKDQLSWILDGDANSLFTKCLLEVLKAEHTDNFDDDDIKITEVIEYILDKVPERKPVQTPFANLQIFENFVLSKVPAERFNSSDKAKKIEIPVVSIISELRGLIENAKTEKAIKRLIQYADQNENADIRKLATSVSSRISDLEDQEMMGIISSSDARLEKNKINFTVIKIIDNLEEELTE